MRLYEVGMEAEGHYTSFFTNRRDAEREHAVIFKEGGDIGKLLEHDVVSYAENAHAEIMGLRDSLDGAGAAMSCAMDYIDGDNPAFEILERALARWRDDNTPQEEHDELH